MTPNKPSSNKQDKARMGPNADRSGSTKSAVRGGAAPSSAHDLDAGAQMTGQDAGSSMRSSGARSSGSASASRRHGDGSALRGQSSSASAAGSERICDVMTRNVCLANPDQTIQEAAVMMADADVGSLPVGENDRLVGMITDRDIVLRAVAEGRDSKTSVREVMTDRIQYCYEDDSIDDVARNMADLGVRRLPVINRDKRLVGIVALSNITHCHSMAATETLLDSVAAPH